MAKVGGLLVGRWTYQILLDSDAWYYAERPVFFSASNNRMR